MKKLLFVVLFLMYATALVAQKARVFEHLSPAFAFGNEALVPSVAYTQTLALGKQFGLRVNTGIRYTQYMLRTDAKLLNTVAAKDRTLTLLDNISNTAINIPIGIEVGSRLFAVGANADLIGLTIARSRDASNFEINAGELPDDLDLIPQGFNFLITGNGTLNSQGYISITPNQNLSIKLGLAYTQTTFRTSYPDADDVDNTISWDSFIEKGFRPFVELQFNFEK